MMIEKQVDKNWVGNKVELNKNDDKYGGINKKKDEYWKNTMFVEENGRLKEYEAKNRRNKKMLLKTGGTIQLDWKLPIDILAGDLTTFQRWYKNLVFWI